MKNPDRVRKQVAVAGVATLFSACGGLNAGGEKIVIDDWAPAGTAPAWSICDIFDDSTLYRNDRGPVDQVAFVGRYNGQWYSVDSNQGSASDWDNRRWRAGLKIGFLEDFTFVGQFNLKTDFDRAGRFVENLEDLTIKWKPSDNLYVILGKQRPRITREISTSGNLIKTVERSQLAEQVFPEKLGGVVVGYGLTEELTMETGAFSTNLTEDWMLPEFDGDIAAITRLIYDLNETAETRFDYFFAGNDESNKAVKNYKHLFSWNTESAFDRLHLVTDLVYGIGIDDGENSDMYGVVLMPWIELTDNLEAVFRYTHTGSESGNGIRLHPRYERRAAPINDRGDRYDAVYLGLNYYICGDRLKLMFGTEYAALGAPEDPGWHGWSWLTGVRLFF